MKYRFLLIILTPVILFSQNYIWPTDASRYMSSSFGEYRPGHYHAAIDIKTWNQEGFPCYAIEDGKILRVRVSPFGYGKALYLQLNDGNIVVYAHLKSFSPELDRLVREKQIAGQRYTLDWRPKYWPVQKGDVIAYTGQTGIGVPHLHFEIRDERHRPVNPLLFYRDSIKDTTPPVLKSLLVIPQNADSRVEGSFDDHVIPLVYVRDGLYTLEQPVRAIGKIGLAVNGYDMADEVYNKYAFYSTEMEAGGRKIFRVAYDTIGYDITGQIDLETFYPRWVNERTVYHKLYIDPYNTIPFYDRNLGNGIISVEDETIPFRIVVRDYHGNEREITGTIEPDHTRPPVMRVLMQDTASTIIQFGLPLHMASLQFRHSNDGINWSNIDYYEVIGHQISNPHQSMFIKMDVPTLPESYLETMVETSQGERMITTTSFTDSLPYRPSLSVRNFGKFMRFRFGDISDLDGLRLTISGRSMYPAVEYGQFEYILPASLVDSSGIALRLESNRHLMKDTLYTIHRLLPGERTELSLDSARVTVTSFPASLYDTLLIDYRSEERPSTGGGPPLLSDIAVFSPHDQLIKKSFSIEMPFDSSRFDFRQLGVYSLNGEDNFGHQGGEVDSASGTMRFKAGRMGRFIVAADTVPPVLEIRHPAEGGRYGLPGRIAFTARDDLSGIDDETAFRIYLDDRFVLPEWDPEEDLITAVPHFELEEGEHRLRVIVSDAAGNHTEKEIVFILY